MSTETNNHASRGHAEFGPSSLKYVSACRGWESRGGSSAASDMGTRIHEAVEVRNPASLQSEQEQDIYDQLCEAEDRWIATLFPDTLDYLHKEIELDIALPFDCSTFGTSDLVAISKDLALVLDYKTGVGEIDDVEANHQSKAYSIGVFQRFPEVNTIHAVFLVPQRNQELHGIYTRDMLEDMEIEAATTILLAKTVRPKWHIGTPNLEELSPNNGCAYCKHADRCPALGHMAMEIASRYEPDLIPAGPVRGSEIEDPDVLGKLYPVACILEKWADGIKRKSVLSAMDGLVPTGMRLRSLGAVRKIVDTEKFILATEKLGLDRSELIQHATFPFAAIRDAYASKAKRGQKTKYVQAFEEATDGAVELGAERFTLVKDS